MRKSIYPKYEPYKGPSKREILKVKGTFLSMAGLEPNELEEWRTIFNLFDVVNTRLSLDESHPTRTLIGQDGDQSITHEELGIVLRSMGQNPSEQELIDMIRCQEKSTCQKTKIVFYQLKF